MSAAPSARARRRLADLAPWMPIVLIAALLIIVFDDQGPTGFDAWWVVTSLRLFFLTAIPILTALLAVRVYLRTGVRAVLTIGSAMLAIATGSGALAAFVQVPGGLPAAMATTSAAGLDADNA